MFHKNAKTTTNAGNSPANVPKNHQNNNKRRKFSRKCSTKTPKQQQTPEILPQMFHKNAKTTTNAGDFPANVPKNHQNSNIFRRKNSGKCSKKAPKRSRGLRRARYETRVGSPPDFQPKRVSAPSCFRARFAALRQFVALANQVARGKTANPCALPSAASTSARRQSAPT